MSVLGKKPNHSDLLKQLFAAGAHFAYTKSRNHPSTKGAVYGYKNGSALIDLEQTVASLDRAALRS